MPKLYYKPEYDENSVTGSDPSKTTSKHKKNSGTFQNR
jgi:hypothetical protein